LQQQFTLLCCRFPRFLLSTPWSLLAGFFTFPTFTNLSLSLTNQSFFQSSQNLLLGSKLELWSFVQLFWLALILDCNFTSFPNYFLLHLRFLLVDYCRFLLLFVVYNCACLYLWNFPSLFVIWPSTFCSILFKNFLLNRYLCSWMLDIPKKLCNFAQS
jgi:hypothetical protein